MREMQMTDAMIHMWSEKRMMDGKALTIVLYSVPFPARVRADDTLVPLCVIIMRLFNLS